MICRGSVLGSMQDAMKVKCCLRKRRGLACPFICPRPTVEAERLSVNMTVAMRSTLGEMPDGRRGGDRGARTRAFWT